MISGHSSASQAHNSTSRRPLARAMARYASSEANTPGFGVVGHSGFTARWSCHRQPFTSTTTDPSADPKSNAWPPHRGNRTNPIGSSRSAARRSPALYVRRPSMHARTWPLLWASRCAAERRRPRFASLILRFVSSLTLLPVFAALSASFHSGRLWAARSAFRWSGVSVLPNWASLIFRRCSGDSGLPARAAAALAMCSVVCGRPTFAARILARVSGEARAASFRSICSGVRTPRGMTPVYHIAVGIGGN